MHFYWSNKPATSSGQSGIRATTVDYTPFLRNLVLLSGPENTVVPRQGTRLLLTDNGYAITAWRLTKNLTPAQGKINSIEAFDSKIPDGFEIELLISVHTSKVAPKSPPGIDGVIQRRLFTLKHVYVQF